MVTVFVTKDPTTQNKLAIAKHEDKLIVSIADAEGKITEVKIDKKGAEALAYQILQESTW